MANRHDRIISSNRKREMDIMRLIPRYSYMEKIINVIGTPDIKVITGVRRCGKSKLLESFKKYIDENIQDANIIHINFNLPEFEELLTFRALYEHINSLYKENMQNFVLIDEVQMCEDFEKAINGLHASEKYDIYITGSNAYFMSGELATLLSGRYVELKMLPLSFKEYVSAFDGSKSLEELYNSYLYNSSFPYTVGMTNRRNIHAYLDGIFNTIVLNDIVQRKKVQNPLMLKSVIKFMFDNIGNPCTAKKISDSMTSQGLKISNHTVETYLEGLTDSLLMYRVSRYDIKGKDYLQLLDKYYIADIGLRYYLLGLNSTDRGHILENVVYLELVRRGYTVYVGKNGSAEVDFVVQDYDGNTEYYQVLWSVREESTLKRELSALESIQDHNPKYILTMDNDPPISYNGIRQINVLKWLVE